MNKSVKLLIVAIAAIAILVGSVFLGAKGRRAEAMYSGAVLVMSE